MLATYLGEGGGTPPSIVALLVVLNAVPLHDLVVLVVTVRVLLPEVAAVDAVPRRALLQSTNSDMVLLKRAAIRFFEMFALMNPSTRI